MGMLAKGANAYYYEDRKHSPMDYGGGRVTWHHTVIVGLSANESARDFCVDFVKKHATDSVEWRLRVECGSSGTTSIQAGYMCDNYRETRPGSGVWGCEGDSWYLSLTTCPPNTAYVKGQSKQGCYPIVEKLSDVPKHCPAKGNPIHPGAGMKTQTQSLGVSVAGLQLALQYDTRFEMRTSPLANSTTTSDSFPYTRTEQTLVGKVWGLNVQRSLQLGKNTWQGALPSMISFQPGVAEIYSAIASYAYGSEKSVNRKLWAQSNDWYGYWLHFDDGNGYVETYLPRMAAFGDVESHLLGYVNYAGGGGLILKYSDESTPVDIAPRRGLLVSVFDHFGRTISFKYNAQGYISSMVGPDHQVTNLAYENSNLSAIHWPDATKRRFHYEEPSLPWALTGLTDESAQRLGTYAYDTASKNAVSTTSASAGSFSTSYGVAPSNSCTDQFDEAREVIYRTCTWTPPQEAKLVSPNGSESMLSFKSVQGVNRLTSQSQPSGAGCSESVRQQDYDANGNVAWMEDFKGYRACYGHDLSRNLETSRVEGLATGSSCDSVLTTGAALPANARRIGKQWHPMWRLETKVAEPRRLTTKVYNGQPDPFNGGATAWCAPSNATLPDGGPIVVLCKQVEQATTDANGSQGFTATLDVSVPARVQQWTYNQYGQVLTAADPLNKVTSFSYYGSTTADYTKGDLEKVTNAANHVTRYTKYNPAGQWLEMLDANGIATTRTFDLRQRLKTTTTAGLTTSYDYWPTGLLKQVTLPDTTFVSYDYDDAHRLITVTDNLGNKVSYTLDNSGNRIGETVTDPSGKLARTLTRVPDALGRIQQVTGRE